MICDVACIVGRIEMRDATKPAILLCAACQQQRKFKSRDAEEPVRHPLGSYTRGVLGSAAMILDAFKFAN
jgi:hypothetical protein